MLHTFITSYRDAIIARAREKLTDRPWPLASTSELEHGVPLFLTQLAETLRETLRLETGSTPVPLTTLGASATKHGRELRALGFNISQVVHDYGDTCQAITEIAVEQNLPITTDEFHTLNRCLDTAMAEAVTEHARLTAQSRSAEELERSGQLAHEVRDMLNTALLAFHALKGGTVAINGSTGTVLGRSLTSLRDLIDNTLADIRMAAEIQRPERVQVVDFLSELAIAGHLHADSHAVQFTVDAVDPRLAVNADSQLLASAVMNLLTNAFKFTPPGGQVVLRALHENGRMQLEVEDQCGGIPDGTVDPFKAFTVQRQRDRTGLGLGLSIARKAVRRHGGDIYFRNLPGKGCVFVIDVPLAAEGAPVPQSV
jgi:signal transduction histidine kinase